jgi:hypothetical protein
VTIASGREIIASGPALCSPLNGVGFVTSNPQLCASFGLLNQNPTLNVFVGARPVAASKPKIWSSKMVRIDVYDFPSWFASMSL